MDGEGEVGAVEDGDEISVLVGVFDEDVVRRLDLSLEDTLHHEHEFVVGDVFVVNGNSPHVLAQPHFYQQFPRQVHFVVFVAFFSFYCFGFVLFIFMVLMFCFVF